MTKFFRTMFHEIFIEPLENDFMRNALATIVLVGIGSALLGCYVLLRRSVFITAALSHTILPGVVAAAMLGISLYWGALTAALATAICVGWLSAQKKVGEDAAIGVTLSFMFALGILLMTLTQSFRDFTNLLFGSVLGATSGDLAFAAGATAAVLIFFAVARKILKLSTCDPEYAELINARPKLLQIVFLGFVALVAVSSVRIVGALLTTALLVIPAATANLLARSVSQMMVLACIFSVATGTIGLYCSYHFDRVPAGAAVVAAESALFFVCWFIRKIKTA
ncbi:MAG: metal ABC transporter permease [Opitutae bacterium]|nr:metal ABC transporter permease [Opitutae bacterium]